MKKFFAAVTPDQSSIPAFGGCAWSDPTRTRSTTVDKGRTETTSNFLTHVSTCEWRHLQIWLDHTHNCHCSWGHLFKRGLKYVGHGCPHKAISMRRWEWPWDLDVSEKALRCLKISLKRSNDVSLIVLCKDSTQRRHFVGRRQHHSTGPSKSWLSNSFHISGGRGRTIHLYRRFWQTFVLEQLHVIFTRNMEISNILRVLLRLRPMFLQSTKTGIWLQWFLRWPEIKRMMTWLTVTIPGKSRLIQVCICFILGKIGH